MRYHKKVYIPDIDIKKLKELTDILNGKIWRYTSHSIDNLKYRVDNIKELLLYIKELELNYKNIFEYYTEAEKITKICYRISYINGMDIILVISDKKELITIYLNVNNDLHDTLDKSIYTQK